VVYESVSDEALAQRARDEPAAFGVLYDRHVRSVLGFFLRRTGDPEVAADLTAETFASALVSVGEYDEALGKVGAWLHGIAQHELLHWLRRQAVDQRARRRMAMPRLEVDDASLEAIEAIDAQRAVRPLDLGLEKLSPLLREAIELRVLGDLPYEEVARRCGCTVGVARVRVSRALAQLSTTAAANGDLLDEDRPRLDRVSG
jgi:RNA polymerase sigma-70 factor (ECF subfamily)